jgi:hypothetical protein
MNRRAFTLGALLGIPAAAAGRALGAPRCPPPAAKCAVAAKGLDSSAARDAIAARIALAEALYEAGWIGPRDLERLLLEAPSL